MLLMLLLAAAPAARALDVNRASRAELEALPGIGVALADRILAARQARPFDGWQDLQRRVTGIGTATAKRLSAAGLTVGSAAFTAE